MSSDSSRNRDNTSGPELIQRLPSPERNVTVDPLRVLSFTEISYRHHVADIGCGPGFFTLPLAKTLYSGKVYALDVNEAILEVCRERVAQARLGNVEVLRCGEYDFPVEPASLDGVFLSFVLSQSADQLRLLQAARKLLKPTGWCSILEWHHKETEGGPPLEQRKDPDEMAALAREAGFRTRERRELNPDQYMISLRNLAG
jgi:ubiquinone/menaquinone biosynthesis C-methylase UbiE